MNCEDIKSLIVLAMDARGIVNDPDRIWCSGIDCNECILYYDRLCVAKGVDTLVGAAKLHVRQRLSGPMFRSELIRVFMHMMGIDSKEDASETPQCNGTRCDCDACLSSGASCIIGKIRDYAAQKLPPRTRKMSHYEIKLLITGEEVCNVPVDCESDLEFYRSKSAIFDVVPVYEHIS